MLPEITVEETAHRLKTAHPFVILDVREPWELQRARILDHRVVNAPLSQLARRGKLALPEQVAEKSVEIVVMCHHGARSAEVTDWLLRNGWENVRNMSGGIDAFATSVDPSIGKY